MARSATPMPHTAAEVPTLCGVPDFLHKKFLDEWVRIPLLHKSEYVENAFDDDVTLYHGTIAKCGLRLYLWMTCTGAPSKMD